MLKIIKLRTMKRVFKIITIFSIVAIGKAYSANDRILSVETETIDVNNEIWNFIKISDTTSGPLYRFYGDSLITELSEGTRQWYSVRKDSVFYLGSETRFHKNHTQEPLPTSAFGNIWLAGMDTTFIVGHYYHTLGLSYHEIYKCSLPTKGKIVIGNECVIPAVAVTETRIFNPCVNCDSISNTNLTTKKIIRTRWFVDGEFLPVAMQTIEKDLLQSKEVYSNTHTFILSSEFENINEKIKNVNIQQLLDNAEIKYDNGIIKIESNFPQNIRLVLYLSNPQGGIFHQKPIENFTDNNTTEFHLPSLPPGQYIVTISAGTPTDRKIIINI